MKSQLKVAEEAAGKAAAARQTGEISLQTAHQELERSAEAVPQESTARLQQEANFLTTMERARRANSQN